jgi:uncharacterized protein YecE (DUF72 family)
MVGRLAVGTSGFAFPEWRGAFYPADIRDRQMLGFYATQLGTVEINYTVRRVPTEKTLHGWLEATPDTFTFALKANQRITHFARLGDTDAARSFVQLAGTLGERLGPILIQCPPNFSLDLERLEGFLGGIPHGPRYAFEFRHASWLAAKPLLADRGAAWVVTETDDAPYQGDDLGGRRFAYLRLRKTAYREDEMGGWASRIDRARIDGTDVFCYVKHEDGAAGPRFARRLLELAQP